MAGSIPPRSTRSWRPPGHAAGRTRAGGPAGLTARESRRARAARAGAPEQGDRTRSSASARRPWATTSSTSTRSSACRAGPPRRCARCNTDSSKRPVQADRPFGPTGIVARANSVTRLETARLPALSHARGPAGRRRVRWRFTRDWNRVHLRVRTRRYPTPSDPSTNGGCMRKRIGTLALAAVLLVTVASVTVFATNAFDFGAQRYNELAKNRRSTSSA